MRTAAVSFLSFVLVACGNTSSSTSSAPPDDAATNDDASVGVPSIDGGLGVDAAGRDGGVADAALEPIPSIDPTPPAPCAAATPQNDHYQFLDDVCHAKVFPKDATRDFACPQVATSLDATTPDNRLVHYVAAGDPIVVDDALIGVVPAALDVMVILVRRMNGVPYFRYVSNGTSDAAFQPWSSSKFMAAANGGARLRTASSYGVGLTGSVDGIALGDLVTTIVSYRETHGYTSNALGRYFHDIGGRQRADDLIHAGWLNRPAAESFGGNYGEPDPGLGFAFVDGANRVTITPDTAAGPANFLSARTIGEFLKRLALHREDASERLPGIQWPDVATLFYGAANSAWFPGEMGGMSDDTAIYVQSAHDIDYLDRRSHGRWRIFSKLGFGNGDIVNAAYACFPVLDTGGAPVAGAGRELVIVARLASGGANAFERDRLLAQYYRTIVPRIIDGRIP